MGGINEGYLNISIDGHKRVLNILCLIFESGVLLFHILIGIVAARKMLYTQDLNGTLNLVFICTLFWSMMADIGLIIWRFAWDLDSFLWKISFALFFVGYNNFMISMLATLVLRLHLTFKGSIYRISSIASFIFSFVLLLMFGILIKCAVDIFIVEREDWFANIYYIAIAWFILYFIVSVVAVFMFIKRLVNLVKALNRTNTAVQCHTPTVKDIELDKRQQELSDLAAKYVMLYLIAVISMILMWGMSLSVHEMIRPAFLAIDLCINILCLYLQFSFADNHYRGCCGFCDKRFRGTMSFQTRNVIHKQSLELRDAKKKSSITVKSNSGVSSSVVLSTDIVFTPGIESPGVSELSP